MLGQESGRAGEQPVQWGRGEGWGQDKAGEGNYQPRATGPPLSGPNAEGDLGTEDSEDATVLGPGDLVPHLVAK